MHLRHVGARPGTQRLASEVEAKAGKLGIGKARLAVRRRRTRELDRVVALGDPCGAQRSESFSDVDANVRVGVRTEVSYTARGGFSSAPNEAGVSLCEISRIGTRTPGRDPSRRSCATRAAGRRQPNPPFASRAKKRSLAFQWRTPR
jgi:hypothetical protein